MQEFSSCTGFHQVRLEPAATLSTIGIITGIYIMQSIILIDIQVIDWVSVDAGVEILCTSRYDTFA